jgi:hypothetical protein
MCSSVSAGGDRTVNHYIARLTDEQNIRYHECSLCDTYEEALADGEHWAKLLAGWHWGYPAQNWGVPIVTIFEITDDKHVFRMADRKERLLPSRWFIRLNDELNQHIIKTAEAGNALLEKYDRQLQEEILTILERDTIISMLAAEVRWNINFWEIMDRVCPPSS